MTPLTRVELLWLEGRIERWIRFGQIAEETILDRRRRVVAFAAGEVFAFVRWASNGYGTVVSPSPAALTALIERDTPNWQRLVQLSGARLE